MQSLVGPVRHIARLQHVLDAQGCEAIWLHGHANAEGALRAEQRDLASITLHIECFPAYPAMFSASTRGQ